MKYHLLTLWCLAILLIGCKKKETNNLPEGIYAEIETNKGTVTVQLEYEKTPFTVANFITLAEGTNSAVAPNYKGKKLYDGLTFHRVIQDFMIQGGDPLGNGSGDAGYKFSDEITDLKFDKGGLLAMANAGPGTNGSQFFITHKETPWLNGMHTIFGHVVENGMETVNKIVQNDQIVSITIIRNGAKAEAFNAVKVFDENYKKELIKQKEQAQLLAEDIKAFEQKYGPIFQEKANYFNQIQSKATKTTTGLQYFITQKGKGGKPKSGSIININYSGFLENGMLFDSSLADVSKKFGKFDADRAAANQYIPIQFEAGKRDGMIPGFLEGLEKMNLGDKAILFIPSALGYGEAGAGGVIPPNANLIFEVEIVN